MAKKFKFKRYRTIKAAKRLSLIALARRINKVKDIRKQRLYQREFLQRKFNSARSLPQREEYGKMLKALEFKIQARFKKLEKVNEQTTPTLTMQEYADAFDYFDENGNPDLSRLEELKQGGQFGWIDEESGVIVYL